jgi:hypothetical protein
MPLAVFFALTVALLLATVFGGCFLGQRRAARGGDSVTTLESIVFGLLALLIGFTFSMALARFEARQNAVLQEANAIGTAALRAQLLPAPHAAVSLKLLKDYTQIRLDLLQVSLTSERLAADIARSNVIQQELWQDAGTVAATNPGMVPAGLYLQSLNELIDNQEARLTAFRRRVPPEVIWTLYGVSIVAVGFGSYAVGLERRQSRLPICVVSVMIAVVLLLIVDLDRPGSGIIRTNQQPMLDTAAALAGYGE